MGEFLFTFSNTDSVLTCVIVQITNIYDQTELFLQLYLRLDCTTRHGDHDADETKPAGDTSRENAGHRVVQREFASRFIRIGDELPFQYRTVTTMGQETVVGRVHFIHESNAERGSTERTMGPKGGDRCKCSVVSR